MADALLTTVSNVAPASPLDANDHNQLVRALQGMGVLYDAATSLFHSPGSSFMPYAFRTADIANIRQGSATGAVTYSVNAGKVFVLRAVIETTATAGAAVQIGTVNLIKAAALQQMTSFASAPLFVSALTQITIPANLYLVGMELPADSRITPKLFDPSGTAYVVTTGKNLHLSGLFNPNGVAAQLKIGTQLLAALPASVNNTSIPVAPSLGIWAASAESLTATAALTCWGYEV